MCTRRQVDGVRRRAWYDNLSTPNLAIPEHADLHACLEVIGVNVNYVGVRHRGESAEELIVDVELRVLEPLDQREPFGRV